MFFYSPLFLLFMGPCILLALWAQMRVKSAFNKYSKVRPSSGMTGAAAAYEMLRAAGLEQRVGIERVGGFLSDHYDPRKKVLRLSPKVHDSASLAAVGVACHEAGHAIQDAKAYKPLVLRNAIVPTASIGSNLGLILVIIGLILRPMGPFAYLIAVFGLALFGAVVIFQVVNLPVEFNASSRARKMIADLGIVQGRQETAAVATTLNAAAMTYVAATVQALLMLLYYGMMVFGNRR